MILRWHKKKIEISCLLFFLRVIQLTKFHYLAEKRGQQEMGIVVGIDIGGSTTKNCRLSGKRHADTGSDFGEQRHRLPVWRVR